MNVFPELDEIGFLQKSYGFDGLIKLKLSVDLLSDSFPKHIWVNQYGKPVPFLIEEFNKQDDNTFIIKIEDINNEKEANTLKNEIVYCEAALFPTFFIPEASYEYLFGLEVIDTNKGSLGALVEVVENENSHATLVVIHNKNEILIPFVDEFINEINEEDKLISVTLPDGLIELFIN